MARKKNFIILTDGQVTEGVGNGSNDNGFVNIDSWDFLHIDCVAKGGAVGIEYFIQSLDDFGNIVNLHEGEFTEAGFHTVEIVSNPRSVIRSYINGRTDGTLYVSASLGKKDYR